MTGTKIFKTHRLLFIATIIVCTLAASLSFFHYAAASKPLTVTTWWPKAGATISGSQPFKALLTDWNVDSYNMFWSVDSGQLSPMTTNYSGSPHKEATVDVSNWSWQSNGVYTITYIAQNSAGAELARTSFTVNVPVTASAVSAATQPGTTATLIPAATTTPSIISPAAPATTQAPTPAITTTLLYVDPNSAAKQQADAWRTSRPLDAAQMDKIAAQAGAKWFGGWNINLTADVNDYVSAATAQSSIPVLVAYNIPQRDCGGYSAGGTTPDSYVAWIKSMVAGIAGRSAIVVVEPDSIANLDCLSSADQATRLSLLSQSVSLLKNGAGTAVYLDAGHPSWKSASVIAPLLLSANLAAADGFTLNVSNFYSDTDNLSFGQQVSALTNGKHFVIDTSRNGNGPTSDNQWCNPAGRALGSRPTMQTGSTLVDAFLWIKAPGESDGNCNGGPNAGTWWADYALGLAGRASY